MKPTTIKDIVENRLREILLEHKGVFLDDCFDLEMCETVPKILDLFSTSLTSMLEEIKDEVEKSKEWAVKFPTPQFVGKNEIVKEHSVGFIAGLNTALEIINKRLQ